MRRQQEDPNKDVEYRAVKNGVTDYVRFYLRRHRKRLLQSGDDTVCFDVPSDSKADYPTDI